MKDLIILGNGMAGMTAALYAKRANLDFKLVGKDEYDFGQIGNAILVENFPCAASQSGFELASSLHDQLEANDIKVEGHTVTRILKLSDENFSIYYEDGEVDIAHSIIYALGASHRKLNCEIDKEIPIHYCALCDGALYKNKYISVIGGGDVAFTQAEYLSKICAEVWIIMCDRNVTAAPSTFERVSKIDNIKIIYDYPIECIRKYGDGKYRLKRVVADESGSTGVDGFFVAGDVRFKSVRQALTAASDGANAINSVINYLKGKQ